MNADATVFVVDDDNATRESVCAFAMSLGFEVESYPSGEEFLATFDRSRCGCLVADYRMRGISGLELQEKLADEGCALPVIVVSGYADVSVAVRAMRNGAITLLEKPYHEYALATAVREAVARDEKRRRREAWRREIQQRKAQLSPDELLVMERIIDGQPNKVIALQLHLGKRTVERHRHNILEKMGAQSVVELARLVDELLKPDSPEGEDISI